MHGVHQCTYLQVKFTVGRKTLTLEQRTPAFFLGYFSLLLGHVSPQPFLQILLASLETRTTSITCASHAFVLRLSNECHPGLCTKRDSRQFLERILDGRAVARFSTATSQPRRNELACPLNNVPPNTHRRRHQHVPSPSRGCPPVYAKEASRPEPTSQKATMEGHRQDSQRFGEIQG